MNYLLDTNACIAVLKRNPEQVRFRLEAALDHGAGVFISSIVVFELWYGVAKSAQIEKNKERLFSFLSGPIDVLPFDEEDAKVAGTCRWELETVGKPIGAYDLLIAAQALRRGWILVTSNVSEFARIKSLTWQDWAKA